MIPVIVKMQNISSSICLNRVFSDIFNYCSTNINGMWNARKLGRMYKIFEFILNLTYVCRYRVNQHLIVLNLDSASINKILVTEFITVKVSQGLNLELMNHDISNVGWPHTVPPGFWKKYWENINTDKNYWKKYWEKVNIDKINLKRLFDRSADCK